ncbi:proton channel OTOP3-like [Myxocyprinus asiaticus]|uniref:proton channel OTOP3-like n=1 Tax=Myxocyprinus asiaticus TaxID=70543 RepID=UPI002223D727|nr:proton channel OTOP3-like [Myxocyprinus asiaticus]
MSSSPGPVEGTTDLECDQKPASVDAIDGLGPVMPWGPSGNGLISGLLGLNLVLFGAALVVGSAFNPLELMQTEVFMLMLMGLSMLWMLWYLTGACRQPGITPYTDHHAGGATVKAVLLLFAGCSLLLCMFKMGYYILMSWCRPIYKVIFTFVEAPFISLQVYLLWAHSKDCVHKHKILTRSGLMVILSTNVLLWFGAVTDDSIHAEIEMERQNADINNTNTGWDNITLCQCAAKPGCVALRKGYEVFYPFNMEFSLLASCMLYVMWKNVGRRVMDGHQEQKISLQSVFHGMILLGPVLGLLVLLTGGTVLVLYQMWVGQQTQSNTVSVIFYGFHLGLLPIIVLCSVAGTLLQRTQKMGNGHRGDAVHALEQPFDENPTRSLDVVLLMGTALGQISLSYLSLAAGMFQGFSSIMGKLDLSFSILSLLELLVQNIFIIQGLNTHAHTHTTNVQTGENNVIYKEKEHVIRGGGTDPPAPPTCQQKCHDTRDWNKTVIREISAFLILSNIMLWVIAAFGAHLQFENGIGKQFYGFSAWFVLVNVCQPLTVFYRMHSVGALMEIFFSA